jgi:hypothetical protein
LVDDNPNYLSSLEQGSYPVTINDRIAEPDEHGGISHTITENNHSIGGIIYSIEKLMASQKNKNIASYAVPEDLLFCLSPTLLTIPSKDLMKKMPDLNDYSVKDGEISADISFDVKGNVIVKRSQDKIYEHEGKKTRHITLRSKATFDTSKKNVSFEYSYEDKDNKKITHVK